MFSKSLAEADRSTERYMVINLQKKVEELNTVIAKKDVENNILRAKILQMETLIKQLEYKGKESEMFDTK